MSLYVWGSNKSKQLNNQKSLHCYSPVYIPGTCGDNVPIAVSSGESHTLVLCESGDIYSFGRGRDGQLGHSRDDACESNLVVGLEDETIINIAAGSASSFAITSSGNVYQWGLIYRSMLRAGEVPSENTGGESMQLHGLAQDQDSFVVEADMEARSEEAIAQVEATHPHPVPQAESRALRDLVRDSTEQWQLPPVEADMEYRAALKERGFQPNEIEQRMAERGREYVQMLTKGCMRYPMPVPRLIPNLRHIRVKTVATGYAHTMLLTDVGRLFGAGYNDRGQLGLGHRINTSEFKLLDFLSDKFVLQVACGQQHSVCRAVDRNTGNTTSGTGAGGELHLVGSEAGADAYVWGNGTLGQLGLGKLGTTKGRLFPTRNDTLYNEFPDQIVCVSAGANFTAVVTSSGEVYSFGHSEYNQHGDKTGAHQDYVHAHYYFVPRPVNITKTKSSTSHPRASSTTTAITTALSGTSADEKVHIKRLTCGACFTLAVDALGDVYSWGWNESGVLGHGVRHFASAPLRIASIGTNFDGCRVRMVSAGGNHVGALTDSQGHAWASSFHSILESPKHVDCVIVIEDKASATAVRYAPTGKIAAASRQMSFPCHRAILSARSGFLSGFLRACMRDAVENGGLGEGETAAVLSITLPSEHANSITVKSLLDYLYMDRIHIASHKRHELALLAADLHLDRLVSILSADAGSAPLLAHTVASTFTENMVNLFHSPAHCDIVFVVPKSHDEHFITRDGEEDADADAKDKDFDPTAHEFVLYGHRVVVGPRLPYFEALLVGGFVEGQNKISIRTPFGGPVSTAVQVDVSGLVEEGIELSVLEVVLRYAYTGQLRAPRSETKTGTGAGAGVDKDTTAESPHALANDDEADEVDLNEAMGVLVAANRLGFTSLMQHCERLLSLHLGHYFPHNAQNCLEFATAYNIPRLEKQCREILGKGGETHRAAWRVVDFTEGEGEGEGEGDRKGEGEEPKRSGVKLHA